MRDNIDLLDSATAALSAALAATRNAALFVEQADMGPGVVGHGRRDAFGAAVARVVDELYVAARVVDDSRP